MTTKVFRGAGALYAFAGTKQSAFLGTCFSFRKKHFFVTAAHCVRGIEASDLSVQSRFSQSAWRAKVITSHQEADLAVIEVDAGGTSLVEPFYDFAHNAGFGTDISAIGFPEDSAQGTVAPTARYFRGAIQRFLFHDSASGYRYEAAELSFGAPAGLSGGPVFLTGYEHLLFGVVCENFESSTYLRSIEEIEENGRTYREKIHNVINYAICVRLVEHEQWFTHVIGPQFS